MQKPLIESFIGRFIKELGDGIMASFNTVSDSVYAALKIQEACRATNDYQLRIGIHLGEVLFENDDVFGDGVNIGSRIQAITAFSKGYGNKAWMEKDPDYNSLRDEPRFKALLEK